MRPQPPRPRGAADLEERLNLALDAHRRGELNTARAAYRAVLQHYPRSSDALHLLGLLCTHDGALEEGIELMRRSLHLDPGNAMAHHNLAMALLNKGDDRSGMSSLERTLALQPDNPDAWFMRGNVLQRSQAFGESIASYAHAIRLNPAFAEAFNNMAAAQRATRRLTDAYASATQALALRPAYPQALNNRGLIALDGKRGAAAVEDFRGALALQANFPEALHNLGTALMQLGRFAEAHEAFARLASLAPNFPHVAGNAAYAKLCGCDWSGLDALAAVVVQAVESGAHAAIPMAFLCISGSAALQQRCAQAYTRAYYPAEPARAQCAAYPGHAKIRIAYLSGDLGEHAITYLLAGVFERHDPARFETMAFSWGRRGEGAARRRVEQAFARFIDIDSRTDDEVVRLMRELQIDIAVDLSGHTLGQRTRILAQRAAPVQVNYLGLPATMGAPYIDYLIADRFLVPEDRHALYTEQIVSLSGGFQPNDDRRPAPPESKTRSALGLPDDALVFCCFNRNCKINPACFDAWMRILAAVPGSVLWLLATHCTAADNLRREAAARGVAPARLVFADQAPYLEYLARYRHVDLFLDTWPFNGGTTVSDALSMGAPVLTVTGESFAARMAGSLLHTLDLPELVTQSPAAYEAAARRLAQDPAQLRNLRQRLQHLRRTHPFFDTDRYRRELEQAFEAMWQRSSAGLPPAAVPVPAAPPAAAQGAAPVCDKCSNGPTNGW